jgi:hypothetical protein
MTWWAIAFCVQRLRRVLLQVVVHVDAPDAGGGSSRPERAARAGRVDVFAVERTELADA